MKHAILATKEWGKRGPSRCKIIQSYVQNWNRSVPFRSWGTERNGTTTDQTKFQTVIISGGYNLRLDKVRFWLLTNPRLWLPKSHNPYFAGTLNHWSKLEGNELSWILNFRCSRNYYCHKTTEYGWCYAFLPLPHAPAFWMSPCNHQALYWSCQWTNAFAPNQGVFSSQNSMRFNVKKVFF